MRAACVRMRAMNNLDYWNTLVGEDSPETFLRNYGSADPELSVSRFLEERGHLYGVVNQGSWQDTFKTENQYHRLTVRVYLLSYLEETRDEWGPALESKPPAIPRRYREKFDQDKYPPPRQTDDAGSNELPDGGGDNAESGAEALKDLGAEEVPAPAVGEALEPEGESAETGDAAAVPAEAEIAVEAIDSTPAAEAPSEESEGTAEGAPPADVTEVPAEPGMAAEEAEVPAEPGMAAEEAEVPAERAAPHDEASELPSEAGAPPNENVPALEPLPPS